MHFRQLVPQFSSHQHLRWTYTCDGMRGRPILEQEVLQFLLSMFLLYFSDLNGFPHCLVKTFHLSVALWPVWDTFRVFYPYILEESFELSSNKLWSVVTPHVVWQSMCGKHGLQAFDDVLSIRVAHLYHFRSPGEIINDHQQTFSIWQ